MTRTALTLIACLSLLAGHAAAAPAKKTAKAPAKPAAKKPAGPVVLGTKQLPGDFGQLGTTYTLGKESPINFTLVSAEYRADRCVVAGEPYAPDATQKLLVLRFTVQNPVPEDQYFSINRLKITAVDSKGGNNETVGVYGVSSSGVEAELELKPAQKLDLITAFLVPAEGVVPKLIVEREEGAPVVRYDLRGKATRLPERWADPADTAGATVRAEVLSPLGTVVPLRYFDVTPESARYVTGAVGDQEPGEGKRFLVATLSAKNIARDERLLNSNTMSVVVVDADGERNESLGYAMKASRDEEIEANLRPGQEMRFRVLVPVPQNVAGKTLLINEPEGRVYAVDISGVK